MRGTLRSWSRHQHLIHQLEYDGATYGYNAFIFLNSTNLRLSELLFHNSSLSNVRSTMQRSPILLIVGVRGNLAPDRSNFEDNFIHDDMIRVKHGKLLIRGSNFRRNELSKEDKTLCLIVISSSTLLHIERSLLSVHSLHTTLCTQETPNMRILSSYFDYHCVKHFGVIFVNRIRALIIQETRFVGACSYSASYTSGYTKLSTQECIPCERGLSLMGRFLLSWTLATVALRFQSDTNCRAHSTKDIC